MEFSAIIVAAGRGERAGGGGAKQWRLLGGRPVLAWSAQALLDAGASELVVVVAPDQRELAAEILSALPRLTLIDGGDTRTASVQAGLTALKGGGAVLIHDAARPFLPTAVIERLLAALAGADGAIPALPVDDTLKRPVGEGLATVPRDQLLRAQTPQAFSLPALRRAYSALPPGAVLTDDAAVIEAAGGRIVTVAGDPLLFKLTWPEDFHMADLIARARLSPRTGQGYDVHRFGSGDHIWLCGVKIPHDAGLIGHSDADVGLHALTDALLGAIGEADIGEHFPPTDPQWAGASSDRFLSHAAALVRARGGTIDHVDVTLVCEAPKVKPHRQAMRERIAQILEIDVSQVSVKATTTEGLGFTGRREGLAAQAVATVSLPR